MSVGVLVEGGEGNLRLKKKYSSGALLSKRVMRKRAREWSAAVSLTC